MLPSGIKILPPMYMTWSVAPCFDQKISSSDTTSIRPLTTRPRQLALTNTKRQLVHPIFGPQKTRNPAPDNMFRLS